MIHTERQGDHWIAWRVGKYAVDCAVGATKRQAIRWLREMLD